MSGLRKRISLVYLVTTALLLGLIYMAIYFSAAEVLYSHYDSDLLAEFKEVGSSMSIQEGTVYVLAQPEWDEKEHGQATVSPVFLQAVGIDGAILRTSPNLRDSRLRFYPDRKDTFDVSFQFGDTWLRQVQGPIYSPAGVLEGYLIVGMGVAEAKLLLSSLRWIMLLSFPFIVIVILVISRAFGGSIVRPVATLMSTADRITRENLEERVPLPDRIDELHHLSATVNNLLDRLQEVILREQTFAADAAHELRTPLAVLKGTLEVLIRQPRQPEIYESKLRLCIMEIDRIDSLVDQLLLMARYESGSENLRMVDVDVAQSIAQALERLSFLAREKRISFKLSFSDETTACSDPALLNVVLENLLSNAVKYSSEGSPVEIVMGASNGSLDLSVTDHGPGMSPEQVEKIFNRFYRAENKAGDSTRGYGLGLALVRRLSRLLGIRVALESDTGSGTKFMLEIPRHSPEP